MKNIETLSTRDARGQCPSHFARGVHFALSLEQGQQYKQPHIGI